MTQDLYANTAGGPATFSRCEGVVLEATVEMIVKVQPGSRVFDIGLYLALDGYGVGPRAIRVALENLIDQDKVRADDDDRPRHYPIEPEDTEVGHDG